jgi:LysM repeat protein
LKQVDGGKYKITGTKRAYRVDKGETIRTIAQQIYGSKGYAPYIIAHNNLKNPDNINAGVVIKLPELVRR